MMRDFKSGFQPFVNKPLFSALAILLLAIGIGANVAATTLVWRMPLIDDNTADFSKRLQHDRTFAETLASTRPLELMRGLLF